MMVNNRENKPHIGIFGRRNTGKSSLINYLTEQNIAIVSDTPGTTTDPVKKSMEIFGIGPCIIIDTAGIDDIGELGKQRIQKSLEVIKHIDIAIITTTNNIWSEDELFLSQELKKFEIPYLIAYTKSDLSDISTEFLKLIAPIPYTSINIYNKKCKDEIIKQLKILMPESVYLKKSYLSDYINHDEMIVMVTPIDDEAPEGRMILPQVQVLRDILDQHAVAITVQDSELKNLIRQKLPIQLVITDSQVFQLVAQTIPAHIQLTSFSILLASLHPYFEAYLKGTPFISHLKDGDKILLLESCTHLSSCEDIGRHKIPKWLKNYTQKILHFDFSAGLTQIKDIQSYQLIIQCGGCMLTKKQLGSRLKEAIEANIPVTNYGLCIAYINGIFERAIEIFKK